MGRGSARCTRAFDGSVCPFQNTQAHAVKRPWPQTRDCGATQRPRAALSHSLGDIQAKWLAGTGSREKSITFRRWLPSFGGLSLRVLDSNFTCQSHVGGPMLFTGGIYILEFCDPPMPSERWFCRERNRVNDSPNGTCRLRSRTSEDRSEGCRDSEPTWQWRAAAGIGCGGNGNASEAQDVSGGASADSGCSEEAVGSVPREPGMRRQEGR